MAASNDLSLLLYPSINDYATARNYSPVIENDLLEEKHILITDISDQNKVVLLRGLYENVARNNRNIFFFDHFDYVTIVQELGISANKKQNGFVFITDFIRFPYVDPTKDIKNLAAVIRQYSNYSFYIGTRYQNIGSIPEVEVISKIFKVVVFVYDDELKQQNQETPSADKEDPRQNASELSDEEIKKQKSELIEEVKQQKTEPISKQSRRNKSGPKRFEPTSTLYDNVFREIINSSEYSGIKEANNFVLSKSLENFNALINYINEQKENKKSRNEIEHIRKEIQPLDLPLLELARRFGHNNLWNRIIPCIMDIIKGIDFRKTINEKVEIDSHDHILERKLASDLLKLFNPLKRESLDTITNNYLSYFENPSGCPYIFEEPIKKQIIEQIFKTKYVPTEFPRVLWGYFESLGQISLNNIDNLGLYISSVLIHPKIKAIWNTEEQIQTQSQTPPPPPNAFNDGRVIGQYSPDEASEIDHLGFKHDVHALAALVAYDKTPLPLAIGLFGNWGSGKSSFMKQLEKRIDVLSKEQYDNKELTNVPDAAMPYCTNITHITFNAWHYSDGNLWASMMVHIFDELLEKIAASKTREQLRVELLKNLSTASEAVVEAEKRVAESTSKLTAAKNTLTKIEGQRENIDNELANVQLSLKDVFGTLMKDPQFSATIQHLAKESGYDKVIENKKQLEEWKSEMDSFWERLVRAYKNIFKANKLAAVLIVALPVLLSALFYYLYTAGTLKNINAAIVTASVSVMPFLGRMMGQVRKINTSLRRLESVQKEKVDQKEVELKEREKNITEEIKQHEATLAEQQKKVEAAKKDETDAKAALDAIDINRQLTSFIQQRQGGNSYQQHLGIISLIRKDFNELRKFLQASNKEKKPKERIIERIVLYIDDLDRCKTDRVVAVLEAVHLLLAFDLFVVVVGVDPRWVSKALKEQYKEQLHLEATEDSDTSRLPGQRATPFDYLEKIFQVPFVLRSMNNDGAKKLLENLFHGQIKKKEEEKVPKPNPFTGPLNDPFNTGNPVMMDPFDEKNISAEQQEAFKKKALEMEEEFKKKQEQQAEEKKEFIEQVENLSISEDELDFMKSISPIIGSTPRTVKRYGNLYRLLRVHSDLPNYSIEKLEIYQSVMLLLSISVSNGSIARPFFAALKASKKGGFYEMNKELIEEIEKLITAARNKMEEKNEDEKEKEDALHEQLQALKQLHTELGKLPEEIKNFSVATLKKYSPVVSRFSFRTLNCFEEEALPAKA